LIKKGKLSRFIDKGSRKGSPQKSLKKKYSSEWGESPPRKTQNAADRDRADTDNDNGCEKHGGRIFGAIVGWFSAPNDALRRSAKRKMVELRETHGVSQRAAKKRPL